MTRGKRTADDTQSVQMGHTHELKRQFSLLSMLGLAFSILNSWTALSARLVTAGTCSLCMASSLAEFLSAYPSAGGQYHWVAAISWKSWMPIISWITGWVNCSGWVALAATGGLLGSQLILGIMSLMNPAFQPQHWHQFLIYSGYTIVAFILNAFANSILPSINKVASALPSFALLSLLVPHQIITPGNFVNQTMWPDGVAWLLGLLQGGLGVTGFDGVAHMIEEIPNASDVGPKVMIACVGMGIITGSIFLVVLLLVAGNISDVIESAAGPLLAILSNAAGNKVAAICLLMFPIVCVMFAATAIMTTSSRMVYAFARDGGLPASLFLSTIHPKLKVPLNALYLNLALVTIFGLILLGSTSALNAIVSASVVLLNISYGIPIAVNCVRGRNMLPDRRFVIPNILGWVLNIISLLYVSLTTVLFLFPPKLPATGSNMSGFSTHTVLAWTVGLQLLRRRVWRRFNNLSDSVGCERTQKLFWSPS
ncbi:hypothetical protein N7526_004432 [Penicillium atrosanguineum]|nr:hypothetical protein N7526_004432 [Penicillium atrosanguineum]